MVHLDQHFRKFLFEKEKHRDTLEKPEKFPEHFKSNYV